MADDNVQLPSWIQIRTLLFGALWAGVCGLSVAAFVVYDTWENSGMIDWHQAQRLAIKGAVGGIFAFWRKHQALMQAPPGTISVPVLDVPDAKKQ